MKAAILTWLKANAAKHVEAIIIASALIFVGRMWLQEHDARTKADATVKTAQVQIDTLAKQQTATAQAAKVEVTILQKQADAVKTAPQAVQALQKDPEVKAVLPSLTTVPDAPDTVKVNALDLFKGVNQCEQDAVNVGACTKELTIQKQITTEKDVQIVALKAKPKFLHRLAKAGKVIGCSAAGGFVGSYLKGGQGAAIGAAAGAGICQAF
jgi:hypothetical protein